jgi:hypothetical protein
MTNTDRIQAPPQKNNVPTRRRFRPVLLSKRKQNVYANISMLLIIAKFTNKSPSIFPTFKLIPKLTIMITNLNENTRNEI